MTFHEIPMMAIGLLGAVAAIVIFLIASRRSRDDANLMVSVNQKNMQDDINSIKDEQKEINKEIRQEAKCNRDNLAKMSNIVGTNSYRIEVLERRMDYLERRNGHSRRGDDKGAV